MNNSIGKLDTVLNQVKSLATSASESTRKDIMSSLRNLANSLEAPDDTMERIMFLVNCLLLNCALVYIYADG